MELPAPVADDPRRGRGWRDRQEPSKTASFRRNFLLERPLLKAITQDIAPVLLIDEIDRADEEFEAYLLEILSDFQIIHPRAWHDHGDNPADCDPDIQRHPRSVRRAAPPLSLYLCRISGPGD